MSQLTATGIYVRSIITNILHRLILRRVRSKRQVTKDYDQGEWLDVLNERRWESCQNLEDYVLSLDIRPISALVDGELCTIQTRDYYAYRTEKLISCLVKYATDTETIVEIGSGAGRNLFALAYRGRWSQIVGLELSSTGREVTRLVAERFKLSNIHTDHIDLLNISSVGFSRLRGATVFSFYCLEQLPAHTYVVLNNLIDSGVKRVIHIEPTPELFSYLSIKDLATISYIWRQDYQRTIVEAVQKLEQEGRIRVLTIERLNFAPTCRNDPTLVAWEPIKHHSPS